MVGTPRSQDPLPEYVSPELVRLIAKNAPTELDFFVQYLNRPKPSPRSVPWKLHRSPREVQAERERETRAAAVEELLRGIKERNDWIAARKAQGGYRSLSAQQTARSDLETLSSTRSSPPKRKSLLSRDKELRNVSLEGLELNVSRILGRDFTLAKHAERVQWPLPPEARHRTQNGEDFQYHRIRRRGFGTRLSRQALEALPPPATKLQNFFAGRAGMPASSNSSDDNMDSPSPPARKQKFPLKQVVPGDWQTFESDADEPDDRKFGVSFKVERFPPSKTKVAPTIKEKVHAAWVPSGRPSARTFGELPPMGPHSSRPSSARLPIGNRPVSPAWVPAGQPSRRPVSVPCGHGVLKSYVTNHGASGMEPSPAPDAPEIFKRAWEDFRASEGFGKRPPTSSYVKPWRWGMATAPSTTVPTETKDSSSCKRKDRAHQENISEVTKFMEAKQSQRRKEQRDMKRKTEAEAAAKKEKERLLQLHHQAMIEIEAELAKEKPLKARPAWNPDFDSARADGIGPWANPDSNIKLQRGTPKATISHRDDVSPASPVVDAGCRDATLHISEASTEETDSDRSRNIRVVLRHKKRGKGKSGQRKTRRPTKPKDPFVGSKKRARWKNSTNMNQYGGNDALRRRELMKIYGVQQRKQREAMDNRNKHMLQSLQGGRKKGANGSSTKTIKGKAKSKAKSKRKGESVVRAPSTSKPGVPESSKEARGADRNHASKPGKTQLTSRSRHVSEKEKFQSPTLGRRGTDGKLELPFCTKAGGEKLNAQGLLSQRRATIRACTSPAVSSATKRGKPESPTLVYFSEPTHNTTLTTTVRPGSPSKQFPFTLRSAGPSDKTQPSEEERKKIYGGGFHFSKASPSGQPVKTAIGSAKSGVQSTGGQSMRDSTSCMQASYSALVIPERTHHIADLDLNEFEQAGSSSFVPQRQTIKQNPVNTAGRLTPPSSSGGALSQSNAMTNSNSAHVSPTRHHQTTPPSVPAPSSSLEDENWQKDGTTRSGGGNGKKRDKPRDSNVEGFPCRSKFDKEWTLPRRGDSFSIVNLYAKHTAHESNAQESTATAMSSDSGRRKNLSHSIPQKARPLAAQHLVGNHFSPTSSSEFKTYIGTSYGDHISNLSESETLFSEILAEASKNNRKRLPEKPASADFIRSVMRDPAKTKASNEGSSTVSHATRWTTPGLLSNNPKPRMGLETVSKEHIETTMPTSRIPTPMQSARMQSKLHCRTSEMSMDGISVLPASKAGIGDSYTDMFSYNDAEAIALHKVRMQLRKEQRLVRKLRRKQKVEAASLKPSESDDTMISASSRKQQAPQKVSEAGVDLRVSTSQQPQGFPVRQKPMLPPKNSLAQVQKHPPKTKTKKTRSQQTKLNRNGINKKANGVAKSLKVVGPMKGRRPSAVQQKSLLEKTIQQLTTQITEVRGKRLYDDQHKCGITTRSFFGHSASLMTFNLAEANRKCISSAVKIISIEDIASDSSQIKASPKPSEERFAEHELAVSNRGGYSDSFLSEGSIFEQARSSVPSTLHSKLVAGKMGKDICMKNSNQTPAEIMQPDNATHYANLPNITDTEFEFQKLNTSVKSIGGETSQHGAEHGPTRSCPKLTMTSDLLEKTESNPLHSNIMSSQVTQNIDQVEVQGNQTLQTASLMESDGNQAMRLAGRTEQRISRESMTASCEGRKHPQNMKSQHYFDDGACEIEEDIMPLDGEAEFVSEGLTTVELPPLHQNSKEAGNLFLTHSPSRRTSVSSSSVGHGIPNPMHLSRFREPETSPLSVDKALSGDEEKYGEPNERTDVHLDLETNLANSRQSAGKENKLLSGVDDSLKDIDIQQAVNHVGGTIRPTHLKQVAMPESSDSDKEGTSMTTYMPPTPGASHVSTCQNIVSEEALGIEATSTIEEEDYLRSLSFQVESVKTGSNLNDFSSREPSPKQTLIHRQDDDNESINSITSPFRAVVHPQQEDVDVQVSQKDMPQPTMKEQQTNIGTSKPICEALSHGSGEVQNGNRNGLPTLSNGQDVEEEQGFFTDGSLEAKSVWKKLYDAVPIEDSSGHVNHWSSGSAVSSTSNASQDDACYATSPDNSKSPLANSDMSIVSPNLEGAQEVIEARDEAVSPHAKKHDGNKDDDKDLQPGKSLPGACPASIMDKTLGTTAKGVWDNKDEDEIPEDIMCEELDMGTEVSTFYVAEDKDQSNINSDYMSSTWADDEGQSPSSGSKEATIWQDQEEVTSLFTENPVEIKEADVSGGAANLQIRWNDYCKFSSEPHAQTEGTSELATYSTAAPLANVGKTQYEKDDELSIKPNILDGETCDKFSNLDKVVTSSCTTSNLKTHDFQEAPDSTDKRPVIEAYKMAKYNLLANFLTSTLLDSMLQAEISDTVGRKVQPYLGASSGKRHEPCHNPASSFNLPDIVVPESTKTLTQSKRKSPFLPKQLVASSTIRRGVKVSNQAAAKSQQAWRQQTSTKFGNDICLSGNLTPSYAAEYVQNLLKPSSLQGTDVTEDRNLIGDIKAFQETEMNITTVDRQSHPESQHMYNKLLFDAVNDSFRQQTTSFKPMPQLVGLKTHTHSFKPMSASNAMKMALASIMDDVEFANTARSPGHLRGLLQKQVMASCEEWQTSWLEANELLVTELADGILAEMLGSMVLEMPGRRTCIA